MLECVKNWEELVHGRCKSLFFLEHLNMDQVVDMDNTSTDLSTDSKNTFKLIVGQVSEIIKSMNNHWFCSPPSDDVLNSMNDKAASFDSNGTKTRINIFLSQALQNLPLLKHQKLDITNQLSRNLKILQHLHQIFLHTPTTIQKTLPMQF